MTFSTLPLTTTPPQSILCSEISTEILICVSHAHPMTIGNPASYEFSKMHEINSFPVIMVPSTPNSQKNLKSLLFHMNHLRLGQRVRKEEEVAADPDKDEENHTHEHEQISPHTPSNTLTESQPPLPVSHFHHPTDPLLYTTLLALTQNPLGTNHFLSTTNPITPKKVPTN